MTEAHSKELISKSYVAALAARAGMTTAESSQDYGIDGTVVDIVYDAKTRLYDESGFGIDYQLKATVNAKPKNGIVKFNLEVKNYHRLIKTNVGRARILIVYSMPKDKSKWLMVSPTETIFEKCAWWCSLKGLPPVDNKASICIDIPESQRLTPDELIRLMNCVKGGVEL